MARTGLAAVVNQPARSGDPGSGPAGSRWRRSDTPAARVDARSRSSSCRYATRNRTRSPRWTPGADDYLTKPFGIGELLARMRVALRRANTPAGEPVFTTGDLVVDLARRMVTVGGQDVQLTPTEFDLLRVLVTHAGKVLTHGHLLRQVWGVGYDERRRICYASTSATCAARSNPIHRAPPTSSPSRASAIVCARRHERQRGRLGSLCARQRGMVAHQQQHDGQDQQTMRNGK